MDLRILNLFPKVFEIDLQGLLPRRCVSVSHRTASWNEPVRTAPSIEKYVGSGRYYSSEGPLRSPLVEVLEKTKSGNTIDFVVNVEG